MIDDHLRPIERFYSAFDEGDGTRWPPATRPTSAFMRSLVNRRPTTVAGALVATVIVALNAFLGAATFGIVDV